MTLTKLQSEYYAVEVYKTIFELTDYMIEKSESPDFILKYKEDIQIGIEITIASNKNQNELVNIIKVRGT